ncbi:MAG TPA: SDR family NAD(P)-dependent oxidoreductase [Solimonas sp.]|nr:SDR family NAD(P)-dependent oxidoreductase [Solimonas sp.]
MTTIPGKIFYITGGTRGIGLATAKALAANGAHVLLLSREPDAAALAKVITARASAEQRVAHVCLDVADRNAVVSTIAGARAKFGAPDVVIHGAGLGSARAFADMEFAEFDRVMKVNLYGTRHLVEAVLPAMLRKGQGKIVLIGSMGGYLPVYGYTAYGTSKFAVVGFAQCLRYELKPRGVDIACFCPGEVETPGLADERQFVPAAARALKGIGGTIAAEDAAQALIRGIERDQFLIVPALRVRIVHWLFRLTPLPLWNAITDAIVARALRAEASRGSTAVG